MLGGPGACDCALAGFYLQHRVQKGVQRLVGHPGLGPHNKCNRPSVADYSHTVLAAARSADGGCSRDFKVESGLQLRWIRAAEQTAQRLQRPVLRGALDKPILCG